MGADRERGRERRKIIDDDGGVSGRGVGSATQAEDLGRWGEKGRTKLNEHGKSKCAGQRAATSKRCVHPLKQTFRSVWDPLKA